MNNNSARLSRTVAACALVSSLAYGSAQQENGNSFGEVVSFVNQHSKLIILSDDGSRALIAVWPAMQGRVLTSSAGGTELRVVQSRVDRFGQSSAAFERSGR